jgi:hypothetical protein
LYQSTLESKLAFDAGTEYESLLRLKQNIIDELRNKLESCTSELATTTARLLSREDDVENLTKQQQHDHNLLQDSTERCTRMETACLNLTKQLTAQGFRLRHMQAMIIKEQQLRSTASHDKTNHNRMCHVSTQCVDIIEQRNTVAAVDTVAESIDDSTGQHDVPVPSSTSSSILPNSKKVVIMDKTNHNDIMKSRDGDEGKQKGTYKVLTMKGIVKVPVHISPTKQQVQPPASLPLSRASDKVAVQSPKKKKKKRISGSDGGVHQRWKKTDDDDNHHDYDNNKSESAVSCRAEEVRSHPASSSSSSNSINISSNMEYANHNSHRQSQYTSNPKDKHRVVIVTTAAVRRRPATSSPKNNAEGMYGFPQRRQPFYDDIENNMTSKVGSAKAVRSSLSSSDLQTTVRKISSRERMGLSSKTEKSKERQLLPLHGSRVIMFDGDYDAQLFVLLDDIEEQI